MKVRTTVLMLLAIALPPRYVLTLEQERAILAAWKASGARG
jgi:hypothetical protein